MTKAFPNIVRLLVVLAMVISMIAITAVPAGAAVTTVTVSATPATASSAASYTINFTTAAAVTPSNAVTVTFPPEATLPTSIATALITLSDSGGAKTFPNTGSYVTVSGQQVIVTLPAGETLTAGACTLTISQGAGITNPKVAKTVLSTAYPVTVVTSAESAGTSNPGYLGIIPSYTISPTTAERGSTVTVTGKGWSPNGGIVISNALTGTGTADTNGDFTITAVPVTSGAVNCRDGAGQTQAGGTVTWNSTVTVPTFTMKARAVVSPTSGLVGSTVAVLGYDFTSGTNIPINGITMGGAAVGPSSAYTLTTRDAYGTLDDAYISVTIPATMPGGAKTVSIAGNDTKTATATFTVSTPTITLDPTSGAPNAQVTVTGSNFGAGQTIAIGSLTFAGSAWNTVAITVDASGGWTYSKKVPSGAVSGSNPVVATSTAGTTASSAFTVSSRTLTLTPATGPSGTQVTVSGPNMTGGGTIAIGGLTFAGVAWNTAAISIDSLGNIGATTLRVPNSSATGSNTVAASDGTLSASATFTVTQPTIEISPSSGYLGDYVTVTGAGWVPSTLGLVTITFNGVTMAVTTPDATGAFTANFQIPSTAVSGQLVGASDGFGNAAPSKAFLISAAAITLDPATGPPGTVVTVSGQGFLPQSAVSALTIGGGNVLPTTPTITDSLGSFSTTFTVPGLGAGAQTVSTTVVSTTATSFFTVTAAEATVANVTAGIASQLVRVWGYTPADGWQMYDPADPIGSDLATLTEGAGYWVNVTEDVTLVYLGKSRSLVTGWQMMGW